jgi:hypothetical protein
VQVLAPLGVEASWAPDERVAADGVTITAGREHRLAVGDVIITHRNDPDVVVLDATATETRRPGAPVRNGQRWRVVAVDPEHDRIAARRLDDRAIGAFSGDYLHEHITHGYAVTVHSTRG